MLTTSESFYHLCGAVTNGEHLFCFLFPVALACSRLSLSEEGKHAGDQWDLLEKMVLSFPVYCSLLIPLVQWWNRSVQCTCSLCTFLHQYKCLVSNSNRAHPWSHDVATVKLLLLSLLLLLSTFHCHLDWRSIYILINTWLTLHRHSINILIDTDSYVSINKWCVCKN